MRDDTGENIENELRFLNKNLEFISFILCEINGRDWINLHEKWTSGDI